MSAAVLVLVLFAAACGSGGGDGGGGGDGNTETTEELTPQPGGSLAVGLTGETDAWHPLRGQWSGNGFTVGRAIFDPIAIMDAEGRWQPYLVKAMESSSDYKTWTIELREGVKFHNGEALDGPALAQFLKAMVGSALTGQAFRSVTGVTSVDDLHVEVTVSQPWANFPVLLTDQPGFVIAPEQLESGSLDEPIGTGPFVFEEWVRDDHLTVTKNPNYWQKGLPYLNEITFKPLVDPTSLRAAIEAGDVDVATLDSPDLTTDLDDIDGLDDVRVIRTALDDTGEIVLINNLDVAPTDDPVVRKAIAQALQPDAINQTLYGGEFAISTQPFPRGSRWFTETDYPAPDPDAARKAVEAWEEDNGELKFRILLISDSANLRLIQLIQAQLKEVGIEAEVDALELTQYIKKFVTGDYETVLVPGFFGSIDPDAEYHFLTSANADPAAILKLNFARYRNPEVDDAIDAARATTDERFRAKEYGKVWQAFAEDLPYIFLLHKSVAVGVRDNVHGMDGFVAPGDVRVPAILRWSYFLTATWIEA